MATEYTVKKGDCLWSIARAHGITLGELLRANPQFTADGRDPDLIYPGETVIIPDKPEFPDDADLEKGMVNCKHATLIVTVVREQDGKPVDGATVRLSGAGTGIKATDATGKAVFDPLTPGKYHVIADKDAHLPNEATTDVTLAAGDRKEVTLKLDPMMIYRDGNPITDANRKVIVGAKMKLTVVCKGSQVAASKAKWTIAGTIVKSYKGTKTKGEKKDMTATDLAKAKAEYHYVDAADNRAVSCQVTVSGKQHQVRDALDVKRPTYSFTSSTSDVKITSAYINSGTWLAFGGRLDSSGTRKPGIELSAKVAVPSGFGQGKWHYVQVNTGTHKLKRNSGSTCKYVTGSAWLLDTTYPYEPSPYDPASGSPGGYATGSTVHKDSDSPAGPLSSNDKEYELSERFRMYLMFKPAGADSIYVPLGVIAWYYKGKAKRASSGWAMVPGSVGSSSNPTSSDTTTFPTWTRNVSSISWQCP